MYFNHDDSIENKNNINKDIKENFLNNPSLDIDFTSSPEAFPILLEEINKRNWGFTYKNKKNGTNGHFVSISYPPTNISSNIVVTESNSQKTFLMAVCEAIWMAKQSYKEFQIFLKGDKIDITD